MKDNYLIEEETYLLAKKLKKELKGKIDFYGTMYTPVPSGKYLSSYRKKNGEHFFNGQCPSFFFLYEKDDFLRISIGNHYKGNSLGEKLAALSDFYEVLKEEYGPPIVFYTLKEDKEQLLSMQWSFKDKEQDICFFQYGNFTDKKFDDIIIIGEEKEDLNETTRSITERKIGLPYELLDSVYEDLEEFIKHKKGEEVILPKNSRMDGIVYNSFEKKFKK